VDSNNELGETEVIEAIYRCEICGEETERPVKWFVINCGQQNLTIFRWTKEAAAEKGARHYCGEAHAQVYISRWFQTYCG
jgi:hypothetical protein